MTSLCQDRPRHHRAGTDLADLTHRYRDWCQSVSFDNALRWLSVHGRPLPAELAGCGSSSALPGATSSAFWLGHRRLGVGGMCVPTTFALCGRLRAVGYDAQVVSAMIDGATEPDHVTTVVTIAGQRYVLDTVGMTDQPIPLADSLVEVGEGLGWAASRPLSTGGGRTWELTWRTPAWGATQSCLLTAERPVDGGLRLYRDTQDSAVFREFNRNLYSRINTATGCVVVLGPLTVSVAANGMSGPGAPATTLLRTVFGWADDVVDALERAGALS